MSVLQCTLKREGLIAPDQEELSAGAVRLRIAWRSSGFAGEAGGFERPWFVCPGDGCGRRAAILYLDEDDRLLCRLCLNLAYPSQRESPLGRARRRAGKAKSKLAPDPALKPEGMHHRTFVRLGRKYLKAAVEHRVLYTNWAAKLTEQNAIISEQLRSERAER